MKNSIAKIASTLGKFAAVLEDLTIKDDPMFQHIDSKIHQSAMDILATEEFKSASKDVDGIANAKKLAKLALDPDNMAKYINETDGEWLDIHKKEMKTVYEIEFIKFFSAAKELNDETAEARKEDKKIVKEVEASVKPVVALNETRIDEKVNPEKQMSVIASAKTAAVRKTAVYLNGNIFCTIIKDIESDDDPIQERNLARGGARLLCEEDINRIENIPGIKVQSGHEGFKAGTYMDTFNIDLTDGSKQDVLDTLEDQGYDVSRIKSKIKASIVATLDERIVLAATVHGMRQDIIDWYNIMPPETRPEFHKIFSKFNCGNSPDDDFYDQLDNIYDKDIKKLHDELEELDYGLEK